MQAINIIHKETRQQYTIEVSTGSGEKQSICPICSHDRKKSTQKCLGFNVDKKIGRCNHCDAEFYEKINTDELKSILKPRKTYLKPLLSTFELSDKAIHYFEVSRLISIETARYFRLGSKSEFMPQEGKEVNCITFPYFVDNEIVNVKYRDAKKNFKLSKDCELVMYNLDAVKNYDTVYITEGEIDCMTLHEIGITNCISVPNGATIGNNNMAYLDSCIDRLADKTKFVLCFDNDKAGVSLRNSFAKRMGEYRCEYIEYNECKDLNEFLVKYGKEKVKLLIKYPQRFNIEGVFTASDFNAEIDDYYYNGLPNGCGIGDDLDKHLKFHKGYLTMITGIPNMGKSEYLDFILTKLSVLHGWKCAIYSPENHPLQLHFSKFAEKFIGKKFDGDYRMSEMELLQAKKHISENFFFIKPKNDFTLENILATIGNLVMAYGIDCFVIDAWNKLEHNYSDNETKYISKALDIIVNFCEKRNVHAFVVAHPTKIMKDRQTGLYEVPNLYNISGSAHFFNKTANGITVHIDRKTGLSHVFVQKVKFKHWGKIGEIEYNWNFKNGRYYGYSEDNENYLKEKEYKINETTGEVYINGSTVAPF